MCYPVLRDRTLAIRPPRTGNVAQVYRFVGGRYKTRNRTELHNKDEDTGYATKIVSQARPTSARGGRVW